MATQLLLNYCRAYELWDSRAAFRFRQLRVSPLLLREGMHRDRLFRNRPRDSPVGCSCARSACPARADPGLFTQEIRLGEGVWELNVS